MILPPRDLLMSMPRPLLTECLLQGFTILPWTHLVDRKLLLSFQNQILSSGSCFNILPGMILMNESTGLLILLLICLGLLILLPSSKTSVSPQNSTTLLFIFMKPSLVNMILNSKSREVFGTHRNRSLIL